GGRQQSVAAEVHFAHVGREADDGEDDIGLLADGAWRIHPPGTSLDERLRFSFRPCVDDDRASFRDQEPAHRPTPDASSDPYDSWKLLGAHRLKSPSRPFPLPFGITVCLLRALPAHPARPALLPSVTML